MIEGIKTKQDLFNHVVRHLFRQHAKSVFPVVIDGILASSCQYRGEEGRKCAIGCLIEDAEYRAELECQALYKILPGIERSIGRTLQAYPDQPHHEGKLLLELQQVHDKYPVNEWPNILRSVAQVFDLEFNFTEADWKECLVA